MSLPNDLRKVTVKEYQVSYQCEPTASNDGAEIEQDNENGTAAAKEVLDEIFYEAVGIHILKPTCTLVEKIKIEKV